MSPSSRPVENVSRATLIQALVRYGVPAPKREEDGMETTSLTPPGESGEMFAIYLGARRAWILSKPRWGAERLVYSGAIHEHRRFVAFLKEVLGEQ